MGLKYKKRYLPTGDVYSETLSEDELKSDLLAYNVADKYQLLCRWSSMSPNIWQYWEVS